MSGKLLDFVRSVPDLARWLETLERAAPAATPAEVAFPASAELPELLLDLAVPHEDINDVVSLCARIADDPGLE